MMIHPVNKHFDVYRKTVTLFFDDHESMECYMRGGICFPVYFEIQGVVDVSGYAIMAGQDVLTGKIYIFEQIPWVSIDNILDDNNVLKYRGLSHWFNQVWAEYFADTYFWQQPDQVSRRIRLQVIRSVMINPKPRFVEVPLPGQNQARTTDIVSSIWPRLKAKTLLRSGETPLEAQLAMVKTGDKQVLPAVHALGCCLMGIERYSWRKPVERPIREILIAA